MGNTSVLDGGKLVPSTLAETVVCPKRQRRNVRFSDKRNASNSSARSPPLYVEARQIRLARRVDLESQQGLKSPKLDSKRVSI